MSQASFKAETDELEMEFEEMAFLATLLQAASVAKQADRTLEHKRSKQLSFDPAFIQNRSRRTSTCYMRLASSRKRRKPRGQPRYAAKAGRSKRQTHYASFTVGFKLNLYVCTQSE